MNYEIAVIDLQLWTIQEQLTYGFCWVLLLAIIYFLFKAAK